ncbi:MAG TPA: hypothetical protein VKT72_02815 [Candidatus Baltobacteraceae bacterium]|nr:hypothetical protein [Candidatus Baltobacteraceae bacterium]
MAALGWTAAGVLIGIAVVGVISVVIAVASAIVFARAIGDSNER